MYLNKINLHVCFFDTLGVVYFYLSSPNCPFSLKSSSLRMWLSHGNEVLDYSPILLQNEKLWELLIRALSSLSSRKLTNPSPIPVHQWCSNSALVLDYVFCSLSCLLFRSPHLGDPISDPLQFSLGFSLSHSPWQPLPSSPLFTLRTVQSHSLTWETLSLPNFAPFCTLKEQNCKWINFTILKDPLPSLPLELSQVVIDWSSPIP